MAKAAKKKPAPKKPVAKKPVVKKPAIKKKAPAKATKPARKAAAKRPAPKAAKRSAKAAPKAATKGPIPKPVPVSAHTVVPTTPTRAQSSATAPAAAGQPELQVGDAAVQKATGRNWKQWCEALDAAGAQSMPHSDIARLVFARFRLSPWWSQMVTVGYEQMRGLRVKHQKADGFSVSATKTLSAAAERVYIAWNTDAERAKWLGKQIAVRSATPPKSLRLDWSDKLSIVTVALSSKGKKTQVSVQHDKLRDADEAGKMKSYWASALNRLEAAVEAR